MILQKGVFIFLLLFFLGCTDKGKANYQNSLSITEGMMSEEVLEIMGKPAKVNDDSIYLNELRELLGKDYDSIFFYTPPLAASDGIYIYFKGNSVAEIIRE